MRLVETSAWIEWLSRQIPGDARLFIGNSLPVREWDFAASIGATKDVFANRGTNGIDGLVSTFAGVGKEDGANWAVIGDLSLMYGKEVEFIYDGQSMSGDIRPSPNRYCNANTATVRINNARVTGGNRDMGAPEGADMIVARHIHPR